LGSGNHINLSTKITGKKPVNKNHIVKCKLLNKPEQFKACSAIPYLTFDSRQSFIAPNVQKSLKKLKEILDKYPKAEVKAMLFGHTDLVRKDEENKKISERRAKSTYNFLLKKPDYWVKLYRDGKTDDNENWGAKSIQIILNYLNPKAKLDINNQYDKRTRKEINKISSIGDTGDISDSTLKDIFQKYMDKIVKDIDLAENDFVPLKHVGCAAFNPIIDIEQSEEENRRVTFFLFNKDNIPNFPCSNTDLAPCKKQAAQYDNAKSKRDVFRYHHEFRCCYYDNLARDCKAESESLNRIHFDSHMHFMTGHCTPMPLLWIQIPIPKVEPNRTTLEKGISGFVLQTAVKIRQMANISKKRTMKIADQGIKENETVYNNIYGQKNNPRKLLTPMVPMPMDMEYAHIDGYKGEKIYIKVSKRYYLKFDCWDLAEERKIKKKYSDVVILRSFTDQVLMTTQLKVLLWPDEVAKKIPGIKHTKSQFRKKHPNIKIYKETNEKYTGQGYYYYYDRKNENQDIRSIKDMEPKWLPDEEMSLFEPWEKQITDTVAVTLQHPFDYMPMYHYDPRRWHSPKQGSTKWYEPFSEIATPKRVGIFIGFKLYTALGYKPMDLMLQESQKKFYNKCIEEEIPILCHCSLGGVYSHDRALYYDKARALKKISIRDYEAPVRKEDWYYDEFVSPAAWEKVLRKYNNLKLCLAHFSGGDKWQDWDKVNFITSKIERCYGLKTPEDKQKYRDKQMAEWYDDLYPNKIYGKTRWIKQIVELMEEKNGNNYRFPNFYVDISYHFIKDTFRELLWLIKEHPVVKERILFGTDWYLTTGKKMSISKYIGDAKPVFDRMSKELTKITNVHEDLWRDFTRTNPMRFFRIRSIADNYKKGLKEAVKKYRADMKKYSKIDKYTINGFLKNPAIDEKLEIIKNSDVY